MPESRDRPPATLEETLPWVRNKSDEAAIKAGCVFDARAANT